MEIISRSTRDLFSWAHNPGIATELVLIRALCCQRGSSCLKSAQRRKEKGFGEQYPEDLGGGWWGTFIYCQTKLNPVSLQTCRAQAGTQNSSRPSDTLTYFILSPTQSLHPGVYSNFAFILKMSTKYQESTWTISQSKQQFCLVSVEAHDPGPKH